MGWPLILREHFRCRRLHMGSRRFDDRRHVERYLYFGRGRGTEDKLGGELRFGGAVSYLTAASVSAETPGPPPGVYKPGASFAYTVDGDFAYALSAGYKISW